MKNAVSGLGLAPDAAMVTFPIDMIDKRIREGRAVELEVLFDGVLAMYHDQGHIPVKALAFDSAVNTTLGLPVVRTSVDHGTAADIAWQGTARIDSMLAALRLAAPWKTASMLLPSGSSTYAA